MIDVKEVRRENEESYETVQYSIEKDGVKVGSASVMVDESYAYCDRIDIDEEYRNNGYGTDALMKMSSMFGGIVVSPDNEDAKRLYERIGSEWNGEDAGYIDNGFGVYII